MLPSMIAYMTINDETNFFRLIKNRLKLTPYYARNIENSELVIPIIMMNEISEYIMLHNITGKIEMLIGESLKSNINEIRSLINRIDNHPANYYPDSTKEEDFLKFNSVEKQNELNAELKQLNLRLINLLN